ncbi:MAG: nitrile hydratase, partial [Sulfitobacter sp.]
MPHDGHDHSQMTDIEARVRALESLLHEKGYIDSAAVDEIVQTYETKIGPQNGAHVVAKAWTDPEYAA